MSILNLAMTEGRTVPVVFEENVPVKMRSQAVSLFYDTVEALKEVTLPILANRITAIIGPSGCGKSSYLRLFNRMNDLIWNAKVKGQVYLDEEALYDPKIDVVELRKRVGMVFQKPNPFPMSVFDNVAYGPRLHGAKEMGRLSEIVERCLRQAALWEEVKDKLKGSAFALSGGQQQRLCIARVLAVDPEVILLDEPCSALDPASTMRIEDLMQELKVNYTLAIVTHNMQQAGRASDYTAYLLMGELIEFGPTKSLFTYPRDKRTEDYLTGRWG
jgi:phosphate transport system ATP-binding protein